MTRSGLQVLVAECYPSLSEDDVEQIVRRTSRMILNTKRFSDLQRARAAVRMWLRHTRTSYDYVCRTEGREEARKQVQEKVLLLERQIYVRPKGEEAGERHRAKARRARRDAAEDK